MSDDFERINKMIRYVVEVNPNGDKEWFLNGKLHREDGPAVEYANGDKQWYLNGELHREDGPAIEDAIGDKWWLLNGKLHRKEGPAIEGIDGTKEWFLNGKRMSEDEHKRATSKAACEGKEVEVDGVTYVLKVKGE